MYDAERVAAATSAVVGVMEGLGLNAAEVVAVSKSVLVATAHAIAREVEDPDERDRIVDLLCRG